MKEEFSNQDSDLEKVCMEVSRKEHTFVNNLQTNLQF